MICCCRDTTSGSVGRASRRPIGDITLAIQQAYYIAVLIVIQLQCQTADVIDPLDRNRSCPILVQKSALHALFDLSGCPVRSKANSASYLAVVLDLKSRKVIGWNMKSTMEKSLAQEALTMATRRRLGGPMKEKLLFHSDRGSQYVSSSYREQLEQHGIVCSMSRKGNCWHNAPLESFFATLEKELVQRQQYQNHQQAKASLFYYIEVFYNRKRRHSALGYISPQDYDQATLI